MTSDRLARALAHSLARHQSRGLVDGAAGLADVVIHGRVDLLAVADEVHTAALAQAKPARRSWSGWFIAAVQAQQRLRQQDRDRERLAEGLESGSQADAAITRLRIRRSPR